MRKSFAARVKRRRPAAAPRIRRSKTALAAGEPSPTAPLNPPPSLPAETGARRTTTQPKPQTEPNDGFVAVGRVLAPFGLKGEIRVQAHTDNPARFRARAKLWAGQQPVSIVTSRTAQGYVYLTLKGFPDRTSVEKFRHVLLQIPEGELPPLPEGEYYRFQLIGLTVAGRDGQTIGTLDEIIETGANDVYRVRTPEGTDVLLPALGDVIISVDLAARRMVVDPPEWR